MYKLVIFACQLVRSHQANHTFALVHSFQRSICLMWESDGALLILFICLKKLLKCVLYLDQASLFNGIVQFLRECSVFRQGKNGTPNSPVFQQCCFFITDTDFHYGMQAAVGV
jgi:hypothetical protein